MAFTTWAALRTSLLDALAALAAGNPYTEEYTIGSRKHTIRSSDDIMKLIRLTYEMESTENAGQNVVSYGSPRRYQ